MKLILSCLLLAVGLVLAVPIPGDAQPPQRRPREGTLKTGEMAPDFTLRDIEGKKSVTLSAARGKPIVLIFGSCT